MWQSWQPVVANRKLTEAAVMHFTKRNKLRISSLANSRFELSRRQGTKFSSGDISTIFQSHTNFFTRLFGCKFTIITSYRYWSYISKECTDVTFRHASLVSSVGWMLIYYVGLVSFNADATSFCWLP